MIITNKSALDNQAGIWILLPENDMLVGMNKKSFRAVFFPYSER